MNIESKLWKIVRLNDGYCQVTQKASNTTRVILGCNMPDIHKLAMVSENRFNAICRDLFHSASRW